jgi:hypothetical protein
MLHVGLDFSRRRVDVCLISDQGELVDHFPVPADRDGLYGLTRRVTVYAEPVRGVIESMNGARFIHDELVAHGWEVLIADAQRVKGLAPLACKTIRSIRGCSASCRFAIWCGDLAARSAAAPGAGALPVSAASGQASHEPEEPDPLDVDRVRVLVPGVGSVRRHRPKAARQPGCPGALARSRRRESLLIDQLERQMSRSNASSSGPVPITGTCRCC